MVRITRVYTKKGDKGTTRIAKTISVPKNSLHVKVLGLLDELNSNLGWCLVALNSDNFSFIKHKLLEVQNTLFDLGAFLCQKEKNKDFESHLVKAVLSLEDSINIMNKELIPLNSFILPGGTELSARLHIARTVCRRAECELVSFAEENNAIVLLPFVNRLSDWLFVSARYILFTLNLREMLWIPFDEKAKE